LELNILYTWSVSKIRKL